jgi:hypothetical protein
VSIFVPIINAPLVRVRILVIVTDPVRVTPAGLLIIIPPVLLNVAGTSIPVV